MSALACRIEGPETAPVVVLLHSLATDASLWRFQLPVWSQRLRIVSMDLPGHGLSPELGGDRGLEDFAATVAATLEALKITRATVVGLSLGGMVAQALALHHPHQVRSLVLAHTSAQTSQHVRDIWELRLAALEERGMAGQVQGTLARWFTTEFAAAAPLTLDWIAGLIRRTSPEGYAAAVRAIQQLDYLDRLPQISVPALIIAGAQDTAAPPAVASAMAERLPRAELHVIERCAHLGNVEQATRFVERVGAFLLATAAG